MHNRKIQYLDIRKYAHFHEYLFELHMKLISYCIKKKIPHPLNAEHLCKLYNKKISSNNLINKRYKRKINKVIEQERIKMKKKKLEKIGQDFKLDRKIKDGDKKSVRKVDGCFIRHCNSSDFVEIIKIQDLIKQELKKSGKQELFCPNENKVVEELLKENNEVLSICVQSPYGICAFSFTLFNYAIDVDIEYHFGSNRVAFFDTVIVLPEFRGNRLHNKLLEVSLNIAKEKNYSEMATIVSPDNKISYDNFISNGFKEHAIGEHKNLKRCYLIKEL